MNKNIVNNIKQMYEELVITPSDINEHLPILKNYAKNCQHITEMGVRSVVSTYALVSANPRKIICIDLHHPKEWDNNHKPVGGDASNSLGGTDDIIDTINRMKYGQ